VRYTAVMIRNEIAYRRQADDESRAVLNRLSIAESIAIGEALLTSDVMRLAVFPDHDRPPSLAIALGIDAKTAARHVTCRDGGE
jgi:hypothetical protein